VWSTRHRAADPARDTVRRFGQGGSISFSGGVELAVETVVPAFETKPTCGPLDAASIDWHNLP
jgi:hypothetical protein